MQVAHTVHPSGSAKFFPGMIEIEQHDHAGLGVDSGESDESNPDRDAHVVTEQPEEPERADE